MNLVLLRRVLAPLLQLTEVMTLDRPGQPGHAAQPERSAQRRGHGARARLQRHARPARERAPRGGPHRARGAGGRAAARRAGAPRRDRPDADRRDDPGRARSRRATRPHAPQALRDVADAVRDSLDEVRRIARELRPEALDDLGLVNALIALCNADRRARTGRASSATSRAALPPLPPEVELVIYRVAQESLTNASGTPTRARSPSALEGDAESVALRVRDDGDGHAARAARGHVRHRRHARARAARRRPLLDRVDPGRGHRGPARGSRSTADGR